MATVERLEVRPAQMSDFLKFRLRLVKTRVSGKHGLRVIEPTLMVLRGLPVDLRVPGGVLKRGNAILVGRPEGYRAVR